MKTPKRQTVYWRQLLLLATIWMVIHPSGATQVEQSAEVLEPFRADLASLDRSFIDQTMAPKRMTKGRRTAAPRCAAWASCNGKIESQKMDRKQVAMMAVVMLSLKHRL